MDLSSELNDSGYNTTSTSPHSRVTRTLHFPSCESTPSTSRPRCRKRKSEPYEGKSRKLSDIVEDNQELSPFYTYRSASPFNGITCIKTGQEITSFNDTSFIRGNILSSLTVDKCSDDFKLSSSLEKCSLDDFMNESQHSAKKKYKWDDEELSCSRKSNSAPGTPQRQQTDSDHSLRKYYSLDLTPTKGTSVKIGTPERFEILYPKLVEVKSPSKIRRLNTKSARKRIFQSRDFVFLFTKVKKVDHVIKQIFSYLSDTDLVNVAKVSELWKRSLEMNPEALKRYKSHLRNITISKENIYQFATSSSPFSRPRANTQPPPRGGYYSPPRSPSRENWRKFTSIASVLNEAQRLTKCEVCGRPAVLERGLARCSGPSCGYLWCVRCLRGSRTEELACVCPGANSPLADRSNIETGSSPDVSSLYFLDHSSGYFSHSDVDKSASFTEKPPRVLADWNDKLTHRRKLEYNNNNNNNNNKNNVSSSIVLEHSALVRKVKRNLLAKKKPVEPESPQKVQMYAVGSKQSKRNLRRL